jgi:HK97 family phage major capsid protein
MNEMPPSPTLLALVNKRKELIAKAEGLVTKTDATAEEVAEGLALLATAEDVAAGRATEIGAIAEIDARITAMERLREVERTAPALPSNVANEQAASGSIQVTPNIDPTGGFRDLGAMALSVMGAVTRTGPVDPRLDRIARGYFTTGDIGASTPTNVHMETNSTEGWMVPPQFREEVWELAFADDLMGLIPMEPTSSNAVEMGVDESTPWGASGIQALWRYEAQKMDPTKLTTRGKRVEINELYAFVLATEELLADAPRLNDRITRQAARAIQWVGSESFMWGDGVGKPLGWMRSPALITVSKESGQAADTLNTKNIAKMFARLYRGPGSMPRWIANGDILPQLMELQIGNQPVWTPAASGFKDAPTGNLLGIPVLWTEHSPTLGELGDMQLVDLNGYYAAIRQELQYAESIHLYFDYNIKAFRWTIRMGGQPLLSAPIQPPSGKGSTTKSHFVTLEAR